MNERKNSVFDGILGDNLVLASLMVISPVIICGDTIKNALSLIYAFNSITFISLLIGSFVPKKTALYSENNHLCGDIIADIHSRKMVRS